MVLWCAIQPGSAHHLLLLSFALFWCVVFCCVANGRITPKSSASSTIVSVPTIEFLLLCWALHRSLGAFCGSRMKLMGKTLVTATIHKPPAGNSHHPGANWKEQQQSRSHQEPVPIQ